MSAEQTAVDRRIPSAAHRHCRNSAQLLLRIAGRETGSGALPVAVVAPTVALG